MSSYKLSEPRWGNLPPSLHNPEEHASWMQQNHTTPSFRIRLIVGDWATCAESKVLERAVTKMSRERR
jgi:hypothetical protein